MSEEYYCAECDEWNVNCSCKASKIIKALELELASTKKMLDEAVKFLDKVSSSMKCDAVYASDCSACDMEDFVRTASELLAKHEKKEGVNG